jgi:phosphate transport system substrate-binding protein
MIPLAILALLICVGCPGDDGGEAGGGSVGVGNLGGSGGDEADTIKIDGSSTVYPISMRVAEVYADETGVDTVEVSRSGTGGGLEKFARTETHISDASRPIKQSEIEACQENGVEFIELPIAYDAIAVVVHPDNDWVTSLTVEDLKKMWEPAAEDTVMKWSDVRPEWPDEDLNLYGSTSDSGTYDYFTEAVCGEEGESRGDYQANVDYNVIASGVAGDKSGLGFLGLAYLEGNEGTIKAVPIDDGDPTNGEGPQMPTPQNVENFKYQPLARPLFIYVNAGAADENQTLDDFVTYYLENAADLVADVGYVPLPGEFTELVQARYEERLLGSVFGGSGAKVGVPMAELLKMEAGDAADTEVADEEGTEEEAEGTDAADTEATGTEEEGADAGGEATDEAASDETTEPADGEEATESTEDETEDQ